MKRLLYLLAAAALITAGCGESEMKTIDNGPKPGLIKKDVGMARNVADGTSEQTRQNEQDAFGKQAGP
jgi:hypothetical protein